MSRIVVDVFGGDYSPDEVIKGVVDALNADKDLQLVLTGDEQIIKKQLDGFKYNSSKLEIIDAKEIITNDDIPTVAIKQKQDSSLVRALKLLKQDESVKAFVSAGSTGAVLTGATFLVGRISGVLRPAIAPLIPTKVRGKRVLMLDSGANPDCKPEYLEQFAYMGDLYVRNVLKVSSPKIALLSNGAEDKKGTETHQIAFNLLKESNLNFAGNIEGRDITSGEYDVIVSDGFSGNVALKSIEGTSLLILDELKRTVKETLRSKLGALLLKPALKKMLYQLDYTRMGGAPFLGCKKIIIKCHGAAKAVTISATIHQAKQLAESNYIEEMTELFASEKFSNNL